MKDRKEYYKKYNSKCKFVNIRFNENDLALYDTLCIAACEFSKTKSELIKLLLEKYL